MIRSIILFAAFMSLRLSAVVPDTGAVIVRRLSVNSEDSDFSPVYLNNKLYFVSGRYDGSGIRYENKAGNTTDIYESSRADSVSFRNVSRLNGINSKWNEGPFCFSREGRVIYFTAGGKERKLRIMMSEFANGNWTQAIPLPFCESKHNFCHPSVSADGKTLYFASDRPGGFGGYDLYLSRLENGAWTEPENCGALINSKKNELFPFICGTHALFFSSDRPGSERLDIYKFDLRDSCKPSRLKAPVNSAADDFGIWMDEAGEFGYFSSNRNARTGDDIYAVTFRFPVNEKMKMLPSKKSWCYTFYEEESLDAADTLNMIYEWDFGDGCKEKNLRARHCYRNPGFYNVRLKVTERVSGAVFETVTGHTLCVESIPEFGIASEDTIQKNQSITLTAYCNIADKQVESYYWRIGKCGFAKGGTVSQIFKEKGEHEIILAALIVDKRSHRREFVQTVKRVTVTGESASVSKTPEPSSRKR